jgi:IS5 family transposase
MISLIIFNVPSDGRAANSHRQNLPIWNVWSLSTAGSTNRRNTFLSCQVEEVGGSAIEPVLGHMKSEVHLGRCYLEGTAGDAANAIFTAVGHNLRLVLAWLRILLCLILAALRRTLADNPKLKLAS